MNTRKIIDYAADDNAKDFRESLYASIYDKVNSHIEQMKQQVSQNLIAQEEVDLEESVTRKHFQQVADLIKSHDSHDKRKELAQHHATIFAMQNPRFDRSKFMKAANVQE